MSEEDLKQLQGEIGSELLHLANTYEFLGQVLNVDISSNSPNREVNAIANECKENISKSMDSILRLRKALADWAQISCWAPTEWKDR